MKKSLLAVAILLLIIALLPIIGNKFLKSTIDTQLSRLESSDFEVLKNTDESSYLTTKKHLQINVYKNNNSMLIACDIEYSNLPFTKAMKVDVYPLSLPSLISKNLKQYYPLLQDELQKFLSSKRLHYHVEYNFIDQTFRASMQDIDEELHSDNNATLHIVLNKANFKGHIQAYEFIDKFSSSIKRASFSVSAKNEIVEISFKKVQQKSSLEEKNEKISSHSSLSIEELFLTSRDIEFAIKKTFIETSLDGLDANEYEKIRKLHNKSKIYNNFIALIAKGGSFNISSFRMKDILYNKGEKLGGVSMSMHLDIKKDTLLAQKIKISPLLALPNINLDFHSQVSKKIYKVLSDKGLIHPMVSHYITLDAKHASLNIQYINSKITINSKQIN